MALFLSMSMVCAEENTTVSDVENVNLESNDISLYYKNGTRLSAELFDSYDNPLDNQSLIFNINGQNYTRTTDNGGKASLAINLNPGKYLANIYFLGSNMYAPLNKTVNVNVLPTIIANGLVKYYHNSSQYQATFLDGTGDVLDYVDITFNIHGVFYVRTTDQNGVARLNINLEPGNYILTAYNPIDGYSLGNNVKVLPTLNGSDLKKIFRDNHQYRVTVRDDEGNPKPKAEVEFNVHGVIYTRTADKYGIAQLNINLEPGNYIISTTDKYKGDVISNKITVFANSETKLTTKNYVFELNDDDTIEATLTNKLNYGVAGETIDLTIGKNQYSAITDDKGVAAFNLDLKEGNYSLTFNHKANSKYGASSAKSTVENYDGVKANIKADDSILLVGDYYNVKLYDKDNKPFANQTVYLNINSQTLSNVSDENGLVRFKLNQPDDIYKAKVFYNGTGYKFTQKTVEICLLVSHSPTITPLTFSVIQGIGEKLYATLSLDDIRIPNQEIIIEINGRNYTRITNDAGNVNLTINLDAGTYNVFFYYLGDDFFTPSGAAIKLIVVPRVETFLTVLTGNIFHKNSGITFNIQLTSGVALAGQTITVKAGSKSYALTTDSNGIVYFDMNGFNTGSYEVVYSYDGDHTYAPSMGSTTVHVTSEIPLGYGYWVRYSDMYNLNLASLSSQGTKHILLHSYAFTAYGQSSVASWIKQANNYGITVHIWMQVAYDGDWHPMSYRDGSYNYNLINSKINEAKYYASISGVGGVHFDYLRFGGTAYNYPKAAESINYFVSSAVSAIKAINPNCLVSAALMPEPNSMRYYDGQDYPTLTKYLDFVLPMVYKGNYGQNTAWIQSITKWFVDNSNGAQVWTGLQAYRSDSDITRLSVSELTQDSQAALNGGARGVVMFRWGLTNFINFNNLKVK